MSKNIIDYCISCADYATIKVALKNYIKITREQNTYNKDYADELSKSLSCILSKIEFFVTERNV